MILWFGSWQIWMTFLFKAKQVTFNIKVTLRVHLTPITSFISLYSVVTKILPFQATLHNLFFYQSLSLHASTWLFYSWFMKNPCIFLFICFFYVLLHNFTAMYLCFLNTWYMLSGKMFWPALNYFDATPLESIMWRNMFYFLSYRIKFTILTTVLVTFSVTQPGGPDIPQCNAIPLAFSSTHGQSMLMFSLV